ncbi:hypothetical protein NicSoilB8_11170 [Arthrobacter sp. NicSoilB8]|nr:hypothetical protein NicSoilB8_11170 [Arthrobacter sp. NicSoilB8]
MRSTLPAGLEVDIVATEDEGTEREGTAGEAASGEGTEGEGTAGDGPDGGAADIGGAGGISPLGNGVPDTRRWTVESMGRSPG